MSDRNRIHKLPIELANQIAAGEVVERPASVLKELLENSLDAGSTEISIRIEGGGIERIWVQDNGCGICKEDLMLALSQHATSKILTFSDLEKVHSFGFRGEALASIASVSRLSLTSSGYRIEKTGRLETVDLIPQPPMPGALVEVCDLFYNTPARRKFLRSEKTESLNLEQVFKRICLSHPQVAFQYQNGERQKRLTACRSPEARLRRIATLCGAQFMKTARYIQSESNGLKLEGWLSSRPQTDLQYFYVNGRMVRDKVVNHAIRQIYQEQKALQGFPAFVLFFELDPEQVDVNVHPTKHEVRFREARTVHAFLSYSVREAFARSEVFSHSISSELVDQSAFKSTHQFTTSEIANSSAIFKTTNPSTDFDQEAYSGTDRPDLNLSKDLWSAGDPGHAEGMRILGNEVKKQGSVRELSRLKPLLLLDNTLWLGEKCGRLVVIDLKPTLQNQLKAGLAKGMNRTLLMPLRLKVAEKLKKTKLDLNQLGFEWSLLSEDSILLRKVPDCFNTLPEAFDAFFETLLDFTQMPKAIEYLIEFALTHANMTLEAATHFLQNLSLEQITYCEFMGEALRDRLFMK